MTPTTLEVLFAPAEYALMSQRDLRETVCVVFDVLRATSTMVTALSNGATSIVPVAEIAEAMSIRQHRSDVLLAGERGGVRIEAHLTGGEGFDLGNSLREFTPQRIKGRTIAMTTTNGTRALRACSPASAVLLGSFLNLRATTDFIQSNTRLICCWYAAAHSTRARNDSGPGAVGVSLNGSIQRDVFACATGQVCRHVNGGGARIHDPDDIPRFKLAGCLPS